ncbi:CheR family methyltransferase [Alicyclobacillus kakegawensis]|uniref:CheR family methyltransferase n=1 Tax=Alicyclobacillus kakegawensis TaxID=392012 RepID=UPI000836D605|nr:protein-glutamate O-methyltransferase CheR [Alicyclobacillus kakegawensis]
MDDFDAFMHAFRKRLGLDLTFYKRPQLERRIRSFQIRHHYPNLNALAEAVTQDAKLRQAFLDKITINVSEFFRNPERWRALWPWIERLQVAPVRVWSSACATGEEPYTLAILFEQHGVSYRILATDIDESALAAAQDGVYRLHQLRSLPDSERNRYFVPQPGGSWRIQPRLQRHIGFLQHDLFSDALPPGAPFHLIVCRNVLIYFTEEGKDRVITKLADALAPGGILFVGSTEQFLQSHRYGLVNVAPFLYQKSSR